MLFEPVIKNPERISVFMRSGIGDTLVYIPALQILRAMYPQAMISFMCNGIALLLYKQFKIADRYVLLDDNDDNFIKELNGENLNFLSAQELNSQDQYAQPSIHVQQQAGWSSSDLLIMTERNSHFIKTALKSNCRQVLSYASLRALHTKRLPAIRFFRRNAQHEIFSFQFLIRTLDKKRYFEVLDQIDLKQSVLKATPEARQSIKAFLESCSYLTKGVDPTTGFVPLRGAAVNTEPASTPIVTAAQAASELSCQEQDAAASQTGQDRKAIYKTLVVVNPLCISNMRKGHSYFPEDYVKLANDLARDFPEILFVISSFGEHSFHEMVDRTSCSNLKLYINPSDIFNVIALIEQCDLLISPSTGPAHIADNLGRDILGAFAYYDAKRWCATGFMQLAKKQKHPTLPSHDFVMHSIDHKIPAKGDPSFKAFYDLCRNYIASHLTH